MKIAIAGFGVEGVANYAYWSADPANQITIVDERPRDVIRDQALAAGVPVGNEPEQGAGVVAAQSPGQVAVQAGPGAFARLQDFDLVVRTAGLAPRKITTNGTIWSGSNEFFAKCPAPIIGVTGSKGKGTTASLIASILRAAFAVTTSAQPQPRKVWLVGNIGEPAIGCLAQVAPTDVVVYELSSFQLWDLQRSPQTAVVLHIEADHLDVHADMQEYVNAKAQITRWQTAVDLLVYNRHSPYATQISQGSLAHTVGYPDSQTAHIQDGAFYYGTARLCDLSALQLKGEHNQQNALAAIDAVWSYTQDPQAIAKGLANFAGLPHRLSFIGTVNGVEYYDDSIATTPSSAIAALRAFADQPQVIILGGSSKGADFSELAKELSAQSRRHAVHALLMGDEARRIAAACDAAGFTAYELLPASESSTDFINGTVLRSGTAGPDQSLMRRCVVRAAELSQPGGVVLLSPSAASFGLFKNYVDRGEQFQAAVRALGKDA